MSRTRRSVLKTFGAVPLLFSTNLINSSTSLALSLSNQKEIELVQDYCRLDYNGAWLSQNPHDSLSDYLDTGHMGGHDSFVIVKNFNVEDLYVDSDNIIVGVLYETIGRISGRDMFETKKEVENNGIVEKYYFSVKSCLGINKIVNAPEPHVSIKTALKHLNSSLFVIKNNNEKTIKRRDIEILIDKLSLAI